MNATTLLCHDERRRESVRRQLALNGLDYVEIGDIEQNDAQQTDQKILNVYFLGKAPVSIEAANVRIEGGRRICDIKVEKVEVNRFESAELDDYMRVTVDRPGDFSTYVLRMVEKDNNGGWQRHAEFDPLYDQVEFSFKAHCPSDLDCRQVQNCPPEELEQPDINYLAKDYASFRRLIFDRLALVMPDWQERHVPDIGVALVEVMAYVGDHLSYYQDAVATEAYLHTARLRKSVRRHARLVDYPMHEGCNARTWLCINSNTPKQFDPRQLYFITGYNQSISSVGTVLSALDLEQVPKHLYEVFEPATHDPVAVYPDHNQILFYTWGDAECCLPRGATSATLDGALVTGVVIDEKPCNEDKPGDEPDKGSKGGIDDNVPEENRTEYGNDPDGVSDAQTGAGNGSDDAVDSASPQLHLSAGDVLIFEEIVGAETAHPGDALLEHRHAVRLTSVEPGIDPLNGRAVVKIEWGVEDALPFPLCLSALGPPPDCLPIENISVARGNVILVDHGETGDEGFDPVDTEEVIDCCQAEGQLADTRLVAAIFNPTLKQAPLTYAELIDNDAPASLMLRQDPQRALPQIELTGTLGQQGQTSWYPRSDLLASNRDDSHFVVETDSEGRGQLRFGDDVSGERPDAGTVFHTRYRSGNGVAGNVGAEAISHLVISDSSLDGALISVRNPLPSRGGVDPQSITEVKKFAPHAFRRKLERAITAEDYTQIVEREFAGEVQQAAAKLRWTGSWYQVLVAVDTAGLDEAPTDLLQRIAGCLHRYRRMGHDLVVRSANKVSLEITLVICVDDDYLRAHVKAVLLDRFSNRRLADGSLGMFHPDSLTFGEGIYASRLVAAAQSVEGVESVSITTFKRQFEPANNEIEEGILKLGDFEIARLDNDPSLPEHGALTFEMRGGR